MKKNTLSPPLGMIMIISKIFVKINVININFSAPKTPQQNGVVKEKNCTHQGMAWTVLNENGLLKYFWAEVINTSCYIINRVYVAKNKSKLLASFRRVEHKTLAILKSLVINVSSLVPRII